MRRLVRDLFALILGLTLGGFVVSALAQSTGPTGPPMTCEDQLDQAKRAIIELRKANAQSDFRAAALEGALMDAQKASASTSKAAQVPAPGSPKTP